MAWSNTQVVCRAEGRADQRPLKFIWNSEWLLVEAVGDERLEASPEATGPSYRIFTVTTASGPFELRVQEPGWRWSCRQIPVAPDPLL